MRNKIIVKNNFSAKKLLYRFKIDIWGHFLMQKKFRSKLTKKLLFEFEINLKRDLFKILRSHHFSQRNNFWYWKRGRVGIKWLDSYTAKKTLNKTNNKNFLKKIFFKSMFFYFNFLKNQNKFYPSLENLWLKTHLNRLKFRLPKTIGRMNFEYFFDNYQKRYYRKLIPNTVLYDKIELLKYQYYFCFKKLSQIKKFLKRLEFKRKPDILYCGLEGVLLNLLFRTNLFLSTRQIYNFIKLGAVEVNKSITKTPYKLLKLGDEFSINVFFIKTIWKTFLTKIKKRQILINIPNYLDFNYKLLTFLIWRSPTELEKKSTYYYPFFKPQTLDINDSLAPRKKKQFISESDYRKRKR